MAAFLKRATKQHTVAWWVVGALAVVVLAVLARSLVTGHALGLAVGMTVVWFVVAGPVTYALVTGKRDAKKDLAGGTCLRYTGPIEGSSETVRGKTTSTYSWISINRSPYRLPTDRDLSDSFAERKRGQVLFTPHRNILEVRGPSDEVVYRDPAYSGEET